MKVVQLDQFVKGDQASALSHELTAAVSNDLIVALVHEGKVIGTFLGPEAMRDAVQQRVIKRFAEDPGMLDTLRQRFESDDLVD